MSHIGIRLNETKCGWVVTDDNFNIQTYKDKDLLGLHEYQKAQTGEFRRIKRGIRRNKQKKAERIAFLRNIFSDALNKEYPDFLNQIEQSGLMPEDKTVSNYVLPYKTLHHAKKAILDGTEKDIRIIYLVLLNYMANRGHFNLSSTSLSDIKNFTTYYKKLYSSAKKIGIDLPKTVDTDALQNALFEKQAVKIKKANILEIFGVTKKETKIATLVDLFIGASADIANLFPSLTDELDVKERKVKFSDGTEYDEIKSNYSVYLSNDEITLLDATREIYDFIILKKLLGNHKTFIDAFVDSYDIHKSDLKYFKDLIKEIKASGIETKAYQEFFYETNEKSYNAYVGKGYDEKKKGYFTTERDVFYDVVKKYLVKVKEQTSEFDEKINVILDKIEDNAFLPKQKTKDNRYIPNALLANEFEKILDKATETCGFLNEKGVSKTLTKKEELQAIFSFVFPYWVGCVDDPEYSWAVRRTDDVIYPWNFKEVLDLSKTRINFIHSIINDCAYLSEEKVLPSISYYIQRAEVLSELNNITLDGEKLSVGVKQKIFNELFLKYDKVTELNIRKFLEEIGYMDDTVSHEFTGFTKKKCIHNMSGFVKAKAVKPDITIEDYEALALAVTSSGTDKTLLLSIASDTTDLKEDEIKGICSVLSVPSTNPWSKYSLKLLTQIAETNGRTVLDTLYETNDNIHVILGSDYGFLAEIEKENKSEENKKNLKEFIENLNTRPYIKRSFFRMAAILNDLKKITPEPETISINLYAPVNQMARRVNIKRLLEKGLTQAGEKGLLKQLKDEEILTDKKILWYQQLGTDIYTGEVIPYDEIMNGEIWTKDHIYPKSKIYDNSIMSNMVLTRKETNKKKRADFPVAENIQETMAEFWEHLVKCNLITQKKYDALSTKTQIPIEMKLETIDRLLIENRKTAFYGAKGVINFIFPNTKVIFVGDNRLNDFKNKFELFELEEVNPYAFAKDAYYTMITGRVWNNIFGDKPKKYIVENPNYNLNVWNYDTTLWNTKEKIYEKVNESKISYTQFVTSNETGSFANDTIYSRKNIEDVKLPKMPISDKTAELKYGGRKSVAIAYYSIIRANKQVVFAPIPIYMVSKLSNETKLREYLLDNYGKDVEILRKRLMLYPKVVVDNHEYIIRGKAGERYAITNAKAMVLDSKFNIVYKALNNKNPEDYLEKNGMDADKLNELYSEIVEKYKSEYTYRKNNCVELIDNMEAYKKLSVLEKLHLIDTVNKLASNGANPCGNLEVLGGKPKSGAMNMSCHFDEITVIDESPTGLFTSQLTLTSTP